MTDHTHPDLKDADWWPEGGMVAHLRDEHGVLINPYLKQSQMRDVHDPLHEKSAAPAPVPADLPPVSLDARIDALEQHAIAVTQCLLNAVADLLPKEDISPDMATALLELTRSTDVVRSNHA